MNDVASPDDKVTHDHSEALNMHTWWFGRPATKLCILRRLGIVWRGQRKGPCQQSFPRGRSGSHHGRPSVYVIIIIVMCLLLLLRIINEHLGKFNRVAQNKHGLGLVRARLAMDLCFALLGAGERRRRIPAIGADLDDVALLAGDGLVSLERLGETCNGRSVAAGRARRLPQAKEQCTHGKQMSAKAKVPDSEEWWWFKQEVPWISICSGTDRLQKIRVHCLWTVVCCCLILLSLCHRKDSAHIHRPVYKKAISRNPLQL